MNKAILEEMNNREVTRLCHFTKAKNIPQILNNFDGVLSTDAIPEYYREVNDQHRFDGKKNYICCSIEYPNVYYLDRIKDNDKLFNEWVIICIDTKIVLECDILFSKVNAATERGKYIMSGIDGLKSIYSEEIITNKRTIIRSCYLPISCATDIQAEVMILEKVDKKYIKELIVPNEEQANMEYTRMKLLGIGEDIKIKVCRDLFKRELGDYLNKGRIPKEIEYNGD